jgi:predicted RNA methylase
MTTTAVPRIEFDPDPDMSFWPTPPDVGDDLAYNMDLSGFGDGGPWVDHAHDDGAVQMPPTHVLEPSAGDGHLAAAVRARLPRAHITCVEPNPARAARLRAQPGLADDVIESTLEEYLARVAVEALAGTFQPYDAVIMNPPFTLPDRPEAWAEHWLAIWNDPNLLLPYARVGAVVPHIALTGKSKLVRQVRATLGKLRAVYDIPKEPKSSRTQLVHDYTHGRIEACERGAFDPVGAQLTTALVWAERWTGGDR